MYQDGSFKSINEKVYKILVKQNDDNRELAETTYTSEEVDKIMDDLVVLDGYLIEIMEANSQLMIEIDQSPLYSNIAANMTQSIGKVVTIMTKAEKKILDLDINSITKDSIGSLTNYRDKFVNISNALQSSKDIYQRYVDIQNINQERERRRSTNPLDEIYNKTLSPELGLIIGGLSKIVEIINMKLLMYQPTSSVQQSNYDPTRDLPDYSDTSSDASIGSGYKGSGYKFSLFNTAPYQPVQKLMVSNIYR
jgi:hypothetical protein